MIHIFKREGRQEDNNERNAAATCFYIDNATAEDAEYVESMHTPNYDMTVHGGNVKER